MKKQTYVSPRLEVIEVENEGVIAASLPGGGGTSGVGEGDIINQNSLRHSPGYGVASSSEIEDLLNDILTIEQ